MIMLILNDSVNNFYFIIVEPQIMMHKTLRLLFLKYLE